MVGNGVIRLEMEKEGKGREQLKRTLREERKSISEVAAMIGISRQAMYKRLEGNMSMSSFYEIAEALGYDVELRKRYDVQRSCKE